MDCTHRSLKFPSCATFCEPWYVAPTADGNGYFNEKYYIILDVGIFTRSPPLDIVTAASHVFAKTQIHMSASINYASSSTYQPRDVKIGFPSQCQTKKSSPPQRPTGSVASMKIATISTKFLSTTKA